jgi:hypothetical protein
MFPSTRVAGMSAKQMAILTATVVAVVVIVTLAKVGLGGRDSRTDPAPNPKADRPHLTFARMSQLGGAWAALGPSSRANSSGPPEHEVNSEGHYDFWFVNDNDAPVELFLTKLSCNRCLRAGPALAPENWKELLARQEAEAAQKKDSAQVAGLVANFGQGGGVGAVVPAAVPAPPAAGAGPTLLPGPEVNWEALDSEEVKNGAKGFVVPAKRAGWVRLGWRGEEPGPRGLTANLRTTSPAGDAPPFRLEYGALFVEAVRVLPEKKEVSVETLRSGDQPHTASFVVYSSTRDHFALDAEPEDTQQREHPFVTCGKRLNGALAPVPLTDKERKDLEEKYHTAVLSGYTVPVAVAERLADGREHDLGPFRTGFTLTSSDALDDPLVLWVGGTVRGDVTVIASDDNKSRDQVALGAFPRSSGITRTVTVEAEPGAELQLDRVPAFLKAELKPQGNPKEAGRRKAWSLTVSVPANAVSGDFPRTDDPVLSDTAIYLKLKAKDRRVRIPVSGTASQR